MKRLLVVFVFSCSSLFLLSQNQPELDPMHTMLPICDAKYNDGIDISIPVGTSVNATMNGTVEKVWDDKEHGCGLSVLLKNMDGSYTAFTWLSAFYVKVGDRVQSGQRVALSGQSGNASSPKLHYTMFSPKEEKIDPSPTLTQPKQVDQTEFLTVEQLKRVLNAAADREKDPVLRDKIVTHTYELWKRNRYIAEAEYCDNLDHAVDIWYANNGDYKKIPSELWNKLSELDKYQLRHAMLGKEVLSTARKVQHP